MENIILESLKYIEENINEPMNEAGISSHAGYSEFHFSRIFKKQMGISVMEYVKQRRLIKASDDILQGMKIIDVTVKYGYESHSGFTRAFKNEYGFSPALLRAFRFQADYLKGGNYMSHVFMKSTDIHASKEELYHILVIVMKENKLDCNMEKLAKAYEFACNAYSGLHRYSGDEYVTHPLNVSVLLAEMEADQDTIIAGMMCDVLARTKVTVKDLKKVFSDAAVDIIEKADRFNGNFTDAPEEVILVKLAERLHNMRTLEFMDKDKWKQKAKKTLELISSLSRKINNEKLKAELNDLAIKYYLE